VVPPTFRVLLTIAHQPLWLPNNLRSDNPCGCRGQGKQERALLAANGADPCTLLSRYRLARGIFFLLVGVLSAGRHNLSVYH